MLNSKVIVAKVLAFEPMMNAIGVGALIADIKTEFFSDPKSWVLIGSLVLLNFSKAYRNFKGDKNG